MLSIRTLILMSILFSSLQNDLMYDPIMYQRDRGELDWDQRSEALTLWDNTSPIQTKSQYFAGASSNSIAGYDTYLNHGPNLVQQDIELSRMDPMHEPLLNPTSSMTFQQHQGFVSQQSFVLSSPPSLYHHNNASTVSREAPIHRPQERSYSPSPTYISNDVKYQAISHPSSPSSPSLQQQLIQHQRQGSGNALASQQYLPQQQQSANPGQQSSQHSQYANRNSSDALVSPQFRGQSPAPRPYSPQQQPHARQNSGNQLASSQLRNQASSPQSYSSQVQPGQVLGDRSIMRGQTPGPQMYPSQHPGQPGNMAGRGVPRRH